MNEALKDYSKCDIYLSVFPATPPLALPPYLPTYLAYGEVQHAGQEDVALIIHTEGGQEGEGGFPAHLREERRRSKGKRVEMVGRRRKGGRERGSKRGGRAYRVVTGADIDCICLSVATLAILPLGVRTDEEEKRKGGKEGG